MPRGRMINKKISKNHELAKLSCKAALLYSWCIPHLDVEGRIEASPQIIKGVVVPYRKDFTLAVIQQCIEEIAQTKDLVVYYGNNHKYMQFLGFPKNQTLHRDRESPSEIPPPTHEELMSRSCLNININTNTSLNTSSEQGSEPPIIRDTKGFQPEEKKNKNKKDQDRVTPEIKDLMDYFYSAYEKSIKDVYFAKNFTNDRRIFEDLVKAGMSIIEVKANIDRFFISDDKFIRNSSYTTGIFKSVILILKRGRKETAMEESDRIRKERIAKRNSEKEKK